MFEISIKSNVDQIQKQLSALAYKQIPFASATAATNLAKEVKDAEVRNMQKVLDKPTPFTLRSVGVKAARKDLPIATIFVKDIAADYLEPYEFGGTNKLNSKALLDPVNAKVNQYGNLPRNAIKKYLSMPGVFVGPVKTKKGEVINGIWQRPFMRANQKIRGKSSVPVGSNTNNGGRLLLLVRFKDAHPVTQHLGWFDVATKIVYGRFNKVFGAALAKAIATAK
jgi:hypothetical protein